MITGNTGPTFFLNSIDLGTLNDGDTVEARVSTIHLQGTPQSGITGAKASWSYTLGGTVNGAAVDEVRANGMLVLGRTGLSGSGDSTGGTIWFLHANATTVPLVCFTFDPPNIPTVNVFPFC